MSGAEADASMLQLGPDFTEDDERRTTTLMNDEVMVLLSAAVEKGTAEETARQTLDFLRKISGGGDNDVLRAATAEIRNMLVSGEYRMKDQEVRKLHPFEVAQLANLIATEASVEEVVSWIPSLDDLDEAELEDVLGHVAEAKSRLQ
jgi:hypothetical protein